MSGRVLQNSLNQKPTSFPMIFCSLQNRLRHWHLHVCICVDAAIHCRTLGKQVSLCQLAMHRVITQLCRLLRQHLSPDNAGCRYTCTTSSANTTKTTSGEPCWHHPCCAPAESCYCRRLLKSQNQVGLLCKHLARGGRCRAGKYLLEPLVELTG